MSGCYYCGKIAHYECDYCYGGEFCRRSICEEHSVPEFEGGRRSDFTLCKDHAFAQHRTGESVREWIKRLETPESSHV
jgi:hypothetical protein